MWKSRMSVLPNARAWEEQELNKTKKQKKNVSNEWVWKELLIYYYWGRQLVLLSKVIIIKVLCSVYWSCKRGRDHKETSEVLNQWTSNEHLSARVERHAKLSADCRRRFAVCTDAQTPHNPLYLAGSSYPTHENCGIFKLMIRNWYMNELGLQDCSQTASPVCYEEQWPTDRNQNNHIKFCDRLTPTKTVIKISDRLITTKTVIKISDRLIRAKTVLKISDRLNVTKIVINISDRLIVTKTV